MRALPPTITLRLLMKWPIQGIIMYGWIVEKPTAEAAALVKAGMATVVPPGTLPHPVQMAWGQSIGEWKM